MNQLDIEAIGHADSGELIQRQERFLADGLLQLESIDLTGKANGLLVALRTRR